MEWACKEEAQLGRRNSNRLICFTIALILIQKKITFVSHWGYLGYEPQIQID